MSYKTQQYERAEKLLKNTNIFNGDKGYGFFGSMLNLTVMKIKQLLG